MNAKKILAGACASLMLAAAATPVVFAADSVKVTIGNTEAEAGKTFTVNIDLADIPSAGVNACDFGIKYDSSIIKIDSVKLGDLAKEDTALDGSTALVANTDEAGLVSIVYGMTVEANYMKGEGTFLVLSGTVNANAKAGDKSDLTLVAVDRNENDSASSSLNKDYIFGYLDGSDNGVNYVPEITNGWVAVPGAPTKPTDAPTEPPTTPPTTSTDKPTDPTTTNAPWTGNPDDLMYGDVNLDNVVSPADVVQLAKYVISNSLYPLGNDKPGSASQAQEQADVEYDHSVDTKDLAKLQEAIMEHIDNSDLGPKK